MKLDEVDEDNILLESTLLNAETPEHLKTHSKLTVIDQVGRDKRGLSNRKILIQCLCIDIKNNNPQYGLITEQMASYITRVLVFLLFFPSFPVPSAQLDRLFLLASPQNLR